MSKPQIHGIRRIINASRYSWQGIRQAMRNESAFREEVFISVVCVPLACWLDVGTVERILMIGSLLLVLTVELLNSAIEAAIDRISSEKHPLSGQAKDMGSAAVFLTLLITFFTWGSILLERYL